MGAYRHGAAYLRALGAGAFAGAIAAAWWAEPWTWVWLDAVPVDPAAQGTWTCAIAAVLAAAVGGIVTPARRSIRVGLVVVATAITVAAPIVAPALFTRGPTTGSGAVLLATVVAFVALGAAIRPGPLTLVGGAAATFAVTHLVPSGPPPGALLAVSIVGGLGVAWLGTTGGATLRASIPAAVVAAGALVLGLRGAHAPARPDAAPFGPAASTALVDLTLALHHAPRRVLLVGARDPLLALRAVLGGAEEIAVVATRPDVAARIADVTAPIANRRGVRLTLAAAPDRAALLARRGAFDVVIDCRPTPGLDAFDALDVGGCLATWRHADTPLDDAWRNAIRAILARAPDSLTAWRESVVDARLLGITAHRISGVPTWYDVRPTRTVADGIDALGRWRGGPQDVKHLLDAPGDRVAERENPSWPPAPEPIRERAAAAVALAERLREHADEPLDARARHLEEDVAAAVAHAFGRRAIDRTSRALAAAGQAARGDALLRAALAIDEEWVAGRLGRARLVMRTLANTGQPDAWTTVNGVLERIVFHDPDNAEAWRLHGIALLRGPADPLAARRCFENAYTLDPTDADTKSYLWRYLLADDQPDDAIAMLADAYRAHPERAWVRDALYKLAPRFLAMSRVDLATRALAQVEPHYRDDPGFLLIRSQVRDAAGDLDGAIADARACASRSEPAVQGYFLHLYRLLQRSDRVRERDEVRAFMQRTFSVDPAAVIE